MRASSRCCAETCRANARRIQGVVLAGACRCVESKHQPMTFSSARGTRVTLKTLDAFHLAKRSAPLIPRPVSSTRWDIKKKKTSGFYDSRLELRTRICAGVRVCAVDHDIVVCAAIQPSIADGTRTVASSGDRLRTGAPRRTRPEAAFVEFSAREAPSRWKTERAGSDHARDSRRAACRIAGALCRRTSRARWPARPAR